MKIGIIGSGGIVGVALEALAHSETCRATAMYCREVDVERGRELQEKYGIGQLYTDMDAFLKDDSYDVAYVGVINSLHYEYTRRALKAGKHVICEKPFTSTAWQARELIDLAKKKKRFLFEAIMLRYSENYEEIRRQLPKLGKITLIQCNYSQYSSRFDKYLEGVVLPAFNPELAGGCIYDINIYCIQFVIGLFGAPQKIKYMANLGENGIDTSGILCMDYGDFKAVCVGAKDSDSPARCVIQGYKGYINMKSLPGNVQNVYLALRGEKEKCIDVKPMGNPMLNEMEKISSIIESGDLDTCYRYMEITYSVMQVLENARRDAGIHFPDDKTGAEA